MNTKIQGSVEMTLAMIISGTIGWLVMISGRAVIDVVFWRCFFGAVSLLPVCYAKGFFHIGITRKQLGLAILGGFAIVINWLLLFGAYPRASISIATAVYHTQPFMLVGLGALCFGERLTAAKLSWLLLAFAGVLLIVQYKSNAGAVGHDYVIGILMSLGAAFFYAVAATTAKALKDVPPHLISLILTVVGVCMLAPLADFAHLPTTLKTWAVLGCLGIVHTGLMYVLLYGAIQKLPTHLIAALSFIYPVVAIVVDYLVFDRRLHILQLVGAALILLAAAGMTLGWSFKRERSGVEEGSQSH